MDILDQLIANKDNLDEVSKHLPCAVHINSVDDFSILYIDPVFEKIADIDGIVGDPEKNLGLVHPDDLPKAMDACRYYLDHVKEFSQVSFLQRILGTDGNYRTYYSTAMLVEELGGLLHFSVDVSRTMNQQEQLVKILEDTEFIKKNFMKFDQLTPRELDLVKYWAQNRSNQELSAQLDLTENTVKTYKKRVYKKLEINSFQELYQYAHAFELTV
ncbi:MAG: LuxR C-terminal-related transcriptional regulator [Reichenbachiella sp.]|uniref:LuxR C-terminal-related transcriptional regulator n=1 Tax=Reichenbachiella sp. TaxID=2184521 RepID=UPI0032647D6C